MGDMFGLCASWTRANPCDARPHLTRNPDGGDYGEYASDLNNPETYQSLRPSLNIYALRIFRLFPTYSTFMRALHDEFLFDAHDSRRQYSECREGCDDHHLFVQGFYSYGYNNPSHVDTNDFGYAIALAFKCGPIA